MFLFRKLFKGTIAFHAILWRVRPKLHIFLHLTECKRSVNPSRYATWMDEDFLKKIAKSFKMSAVGAAQSTVLQKWLMAIPRQFQRAAETV